jgi:hypothetical protein
MSKEYPLYPELSEQGQKESQILIDHFKDKLKKVADEVIGDLYVDLPSYIESDSWSNFRNEIMNGFKDYDTRKKQNEYDFKEIREQIFKEYREDIIKDLNSDLVEENEKLKKENKEAWEMYHKSI